MKSNGPVIIIEDDLDDQEILREVYASLNYPNAIVFFNSCEQALNYLNQNDVHPFFILSDINMPKMDGFALRNKILASNLTRIKCIPFLFFSTGATPKSVVEVYSSSVQGFFLKQYSLDELRKTISVIMDYWKRCIAP